jgi:flagellar protein FlbD
VIRVTRLNGDSFSLNPDLIEKIEAHPDTVITLVDDTKYVIRESEADVNIAIRDFRASIIATASLIANGSYTPAPSSQGGTVVQFPGSGQGA